MASVIKKFSVGIDDVAKDVVESGALDTPPTGKISLYINAANNQRVVDIEVAWRQIHDYIIDRELNDDASAATTYVWVPIGGGSDQIAEESILGNIPVNSLIIGMAGNFRTLGLGTEIFTAAVTYAMTYARNEYFGIRNWPASLAFTLTVGEDADKDVTGLQKGETRPDTFGVADPDSWGDGTPLANVNVNTAGDVVVSGGSLTKFNDADQLTLTVGIQTPVVVTAVAGGIYTAAGAGALHTYLQTVIGGDEATTLVPV